MLAGTDNTELKFYSVPIAPKSAASSTTTTATTTTTTTTATTDTEITWVDIPITKLSPIPSRTCIVAVNITVYLLFLLFAVIFMMNAACGTPNIELVPIFGTYVLLSMMILVMDIIYTKYVILRKNIRKHRRRR